MPDEPKFRYADGSGSNPGPVLDAPKNVTLQQFITLQQFMKAHHAPWHMRLSIALGIAYSKVVGRLTRPFR
jgi:hypothetical protein